MWENYFWSPCFVKLVFFFFTSISVTDLHSRVLLSHVPPFWQVTGQSATAVVTGKATIVKFERVRSSPFTFAHGCSDIAMDTDAKEKQARKHDMHI